MSLENDALIGVNGSAAQHHGVFVPSGNSYPINLNAMSKYEKLKEPSTGGSASLGPRSYKPPAADTSMLSESTSGRDSCKSLGSLAPFPDKPANFYQRPPLITEAQALY